MKKLKQKSAVRKESKGFYGAYARWSAKKRSREFVLTSLAFLVRGTSGGIAA